MTIIRPFSAYSPTKIQSIVGGKAFHDITVKAFSKEYKLNKTLLALHSDYFWTLFQSELFDSSIGVVDLGCDLMFGEGTWIKVLEIIHGTLSIDELNSKLGMSDCLQLMHALRYLQIFGADHLVIPVLGKHWKSSFESLDVDQCFLLDSCKFFEAELIADYPKKDSQTFWLKMLLQNLSYSVCLDFNALPGNILRKLVNDPDFLVPGETERFNLFEEATRPRGTDDDGLLKTVRSELFDSIDFRYLSLNHCPPVSERTLPAEEMEMLLRASIKQVNGGNSLSRYYGSVVVFGKDEAQMTLDTAVCKITFIKNNYGISYQHTSCSRVRGMSFLHSGTNVFSEASPTHGYHNYNHQQFLTNKDGKILCKFKCA